MSSTAIVSKVSGAAFVIRGGQEIAVSQGMELLVSDSIRTGMNGQCELRFADETEVQLSPMSQVQIQDFAFNPDTPAENSFAMHMMEGLVRTVSGEVVKLNPEGFALSTPLGTAGIRGTTVIAQIFPTHVVFMVTEMGAGHTVVINSVFGGDLTILMPGQGAEISLTEQQRITLIDSMPENMRDAVRDFFENKYEDVRSSHDNSILLFGDLEFLAAVGAEDVGRGVGMLSAENEEILIELLQELGVEQPEFFLEAEFGPSTANGYILIWGDEIGNSLMPTEDKFGADFKNLMYDIRGFEASDEIVSFNGEDIVYGGQGDGVSDTDLIYKISAEITSGSLIVGGDETLTGVSSLDSDEIILRSQGNTPDDYSGWISQSLPDYGATVMSGGSVVGSAVNLSNSSGGGNSIDLYGTMTGGAIYGSAVNSSNNNLSGNFITISPGLGADGVTPTGGLLAGGAICGDAQSITGGTAGSDSINVYSMTGGVIYGDAATGSAYTPGENTINIETAMSGGTINSGDGDDSIRVGTLSGSGIINSGTGDDSIGVTTMSGGTINSGGGDNNINVTTAMSGGTINAGAGNDYVRIGTYQGGDIYMGLHNSTLLDVNHLEITNQEADLLLKGVTGATEISITNVLNNSALGVETLDGDLSFMASTPDSLGVSTWKSGKIDLTDGNPQSLTVGTVTSGELVMDANDAVTITDLNGAFEVGNGTVDQKISVTNLNSGSTLTTGEGNDNIAIAYYNGGTIDMGGGSDNKLTITTQNADLTLADLAGSTLSINVGAAGTSDYISIDYMDTMSALILDDSVSGKTVKIGTSQGQPGFNNKITLGGGNILDVDALRGFNYVYGDGRDMADTVCGDNVIYIGTEFGTSAHVTGDAYIMENCTGGNDYIQIGTTGGGSVWGDADAISLNSICGNDEIVITDMPSGTIYGDGSDISDSTCGNDTITIGSMRFGDIYGDGPILSNCTAGNNSISIDNLYTADPKRIRAGDGKDTVVISGWDTDAANTTVSLSNQSTVAGDGKQDYLDLRGIDVSKLESSTTINVTGFDLGVTGGLYDKIVYDDTKWTSITYEAADKYILSSTASSYTLTLIIAGVTDDSHRPNLFSTGDIP